MHVPYSFIIIGIIYKDESFWVASSCMDTASQYGETVLKIGVSALKCCIYKFFWWQNTSNLHVLNRGCLLSQGIVPWPEAVDANGVALGFSSHSRQAAEHYVDRLELIRDCVRAGTQKMGSYWDWALREDNVPFNWWMWHKCWWWNVKRRDSKRWNLLHGASQVRNFITL